MNDKIIAYGQWVVKNRWLVLFLSLIASAALASGVTRLGFDTDYRVFFNKDNPQVQAFDAVEAIYTKNDNVLFVLEAPEGDVFEPNFLSIIEELTRRAWKVPYAIRVDSITNFQHSWAQGDDLVVEDLVSDAKSYSPEDLVRKKEVALKEPVLRNRLISADARVTGVNVTVQIPKGEKDETIVVAHYAQDLAREFEEKYKLPIRLTGMVMLNNAFQETGMKDMQTLMPIMYGIIFLTIGLLLRSWASMFAVFLVITISIFVGMGATGWLGFDLNASTASSPIMIMTLAVADSIHLLVSTLGLMRKGKDKYGAIVEAIRINMVPVFLTSLTTCIGLFAMNFGDVPPFRDLGNIVAMGVIAAFVASVFFMPAFLAVVPLRVKQGKEEQGVRLERFANWVIKSRKSVFFCSLFAIIILAALLPQNELNDEFVEYFDLSTQFRQDTDFANENLTGIYFIEFSLESGESGGINNPAYLKKVGEFADWFRKQPGVLHVNTLTDTMKRLNRNMHGDDPGWYRLPDTRELAAQYLLLYEFSLPYGLDLNNRINIDKSATRFTVTMKNVSAKDLRDLAEQAEEWLKENAPAPMQNIAVGTSLMFSYLSERNVKSQLLAAVIAFILISITLIYVFRSFRYGLLSLVPNAVPAIMAFGIWGILIGLVNMGLAVVTGMTLGIVVDDTIHFMTKYLRARREQNLRRSDAVRYSFETVGSAMLTTTFVLVAGFFVITCSTFEVNAGLGRLSAITIACALIADFFFLPVLLMRVDKPSMKVKGPK